MNCPHCQADLADTDHGTAAAIKQILDDIGQLLMLAYSRRRCFVCGKLGPCSHREPEIELAIIRAEWGPQ